MIKRLDDFSGLFTDFKFPERIEKLRFRFAEIAQAKEAQVIQGPGGPYEMRFSSKEQADKHLKEAKTIANQLAASEQLRQKYNWIFGLIKISLKRHRLSQDPNKIIDFATSGDTAASPEKNSAAFALISAGQFCKAYANDEIEKAVAAFSEMELNSFAATLYKNYPDIQTPIRQGHSQELAQFIDRAKDYSKSQTKKAIKGAAARHGDRKALNEIIKKLAARKDELGKKLPPKELWPEFYSELDNRQLKPQDSSGSVITDKDKMTWNGDGSGMTFKTFEEKIRKARKK